MPENGHVNGRLDPTPEKIAARAARIQGERGREPSAGPRPQKTGTLRAQLARIAAQVTPLVESDPAAPL